MNLKVSILCGCFLIVLMLGCAPRAKDDASPRSMSGLEESGATDAIKKPDSQNIDLPTFNPTAITKPFPVIRDVPTEPSTSDKVADDDLVLGVTIHGESRAYPISALEGATREVINDRLGNTPIAATW